MDHLLTDFARLVSSSFGDRPCYFGLWNKDKNCLESYYGLPELEFYRGAIESVLLDASTKEKETVFSGFFEIQQGTTKLSHAYQAWKFDSKIGLTTGLLVFFNTENENSFISDSTIKPWLDFLKNNLECFSSKRTENEAAVFKAVLDNSSEIIILIDSNHRVLEFNEFAKKLLYGYFHVTIHKGDDYRDFVLPHIMKLYLEGFHTGLRGERFFVEHNTVLDQISNWFEYYMFPVYNQANKLIGVCLRGKDITAQKTAELELKELAETFNALNENLNESLVILSKDYQILRYNGFAKERLRNTMEKELQPGLDFRDFIYPDGKEVFCEKFQRAVEGELIESEGVYTSPNGSKSWIRTRYIPVTLENGKLLGIGLLVRDIQEQKMLQLALQESEEKFRKIVSSAAMAILITDHQMRITTVNPEVSRIFGYSEQELLGQSIQFLIPQRFHQVHSRHQEHYAQSPVPLRMMENRDTKALKKNGDEIDVEVSLNSFKLGETTYFMAMILDVTEKNKLARLLNNASELALTGNWDYTSLESGEETLYWSPMTRKIFEVSEDYIPRFEDLSKFFEEESLTLLHHAIQELYDTGKGYDLELMILTAGGKKKWARAIGSLELVNRDGVKIFGSLQDITQKKLNEIELVHSLQSVKNYKEAIEKSSLVLVTGLDGIVLDVNDAWCQLAGYSREELIGASSNTTKSDYHDESFFEDLWSTISSGKIWKGEIKDISKNGDYFWVDTTIVPMKNENGEVYQYITIRNDISDKKKAIEELEIRAKELARSNSELEQFAYVASHDLQEPLRMVTSFLTLLKRKYSSNLDESAVKYIDFAVDGALRMRSTILDLLEFSRIGKGEEEKQEIKVDRILEEIKILQKKSIEESQARIFYENLPIIRTYKAQLLQVFGNLVSNAVKYCQPNQAPVIQISVEDKGSFWEFSVSDNGIGFSMEYSEKVFVIFQRLHTRASYQGNGIGLAIVRKVIENLHGKIWVKSKENVGSTFYFTLPK